MNEGNERSEGPEVGSDELADLAAEYRVNISEVPEPVRRLIGALANDKLRLSLQVSELKGDVVRLIGERDELGARLREAERRAAQAENRAERADLDELTGLPSRRTLLSEIRAAALVVKARPDGLRRSEDTLGQRTVLFFLDIDNFKPNNDEIGHLFGDLVLRRIADHVRRGLREEDKFYRWGGDEFAIKADVVEGHEKDISNHVIAKVEAACNEIAGLVDALEAFELLYDLCLERVQALPKDVIKDKMKAVLSAVSVSVGAIAIEPGMTTDELIRRADSTMYVMKENKSNAGAKRARLSAEPEES